VLNVLQFSVMLKTENFLCLCTIAVKHLYFSKGEAVLQLHALLTSAIHSDDLFGNRNFFFFLNYRNRNTNPQTSRYGLVAIVTYTIQNPVTLSTRDIHKVNNNYQTQLSSFCVIYCVIYGYLCFKQHGLKSILTNFIQQY
jgi:hypothetical protein